MSLPEATRLQYLAQLGIEQWLPRDAAVAVDDVVALDEPVPAVPAVAVVPGVASATQSSPVTPAPPGITAAAREMLDALRAKPAARQPVTAAPVKPAEPAPAPTPVVQAEVDERIGCSLLLLPGGLLLVADFSRPDAPGLGSQEHEMFMRLAAALSDGQPLPATQDFFWPPVGLKLPNMHVPGAAAKALGAKLEDLQRRGLRVVAVLGDGRLLARLLAPMGLPAPVVTVTLAAMLAAPELKRECWNALAPLKSGSLL